MIKLILSLSFAISLLSAVTIDELAKSSFKKRIMI